MVNAGDSFGVREDLKREKASAPAIVNIDALPSKKTGIN
jgi:hypothetical protein